MLFRKRRTKSRDSASLTQDQTLVATIAGSDYMVDHRFMTEGSGKKVLKKICSYYKKKSISPKNLRLQSRSKQDLNADLLYTVMEIIDPALEESAEPKKM